MIEKLGSSISVGQVLYEAGVEGEGFEPTLKPLLDCMEIGTRLAEYADLYDQRWVSAVKDGLLQTFDYFISRLFAKEGIGEVSFETCDGQPTATAEGVRLGIRYYLALRGKIGGDGKSDDLLNYLILLRSRLLATSGKM